MYMDGVVLAGIATVAMVFATLVYLTYYGYQRLREEEKNAAGQKEESPAENRGD